jgi:hypothetical protein
VAAAARAGGVSEEDATPPERPPAPPVIDVRPYRWAVGLLGLVLVAAFSIYQLTKGGSASPGIAPGQRLPYFAAPLAASTLEGDANTAPPCTAARHDPRALNVCLLAKRGPLVLAFFVTGYSSCVREVDTLDAVSRQFPAGSVQFAAVAVHTGHSETAKLVRTHRWTIPVAYDRDGAAGAVSGFEICPMVELVRRGGVVAYRLIGQQWVAQGAVAPFVRRLAAGR